VDEKTYYFLTFTTYGTHLHGDERGSVKRGRKGAPPRFLPPSAESVARASNLMDGPPFTLNERQRASVAATIRETCAVKQWTLHALNVRTNHVHLLVTSTKTPEAVMNACKAWGTRRLREQGLLGPDVRVWTRHGSTEYIKGERGFRQVAEYILDGQGPDLGGRELGALE
jgi:REP element-mobilizing transposase RayT